MTSIPDELKHLMGAMNGADLGSPLMDVDLETAKAWLKEKLSEKRYQHSLGTAKKSVELAEGLGCSEHQVEMCQVAALLHDCAKDMPEEALLTYCRRHQLHIETDDRRAPQTLHAVVGAQMVRETFEIQQPEVLDAIRWHTTGRSHMRLIEKIVYIADKTEPVLRDAAFAQQALSFLKYGRIETLDVVMLFLLNNTLDFLMRRGQFVHPETMNARNEMLKRVQRLSIPLDELYGQPMAGLGC